MFDSTFGKKSKSFGSGRLKLLEVLYLSFKFNFGRESEHFTPKVLNTLLVFL